MGIRTLVLCLAVVAACASGENRNAAPCTVATDCPTSETTCATPMCTDGACATAMTAAGTVCSDNGGKVCDGAGACVECADVTRDCPPATSDCEQPACTAGRCATNALAANTPAPTGQTTGDCKLVVCDGSGATMTVDDNDPLDDGNDCTADMCAAGSNAPAPVTAGTPCTTNGGTVCGSGAKLGTCVACIANAQCTGGQVCDTRNDSDTCVSPSCTDQQKDGNETGVDCGGSCSPCGNGGGCTIGGDCTSGYCAGTTCAACANDMQCPGADYCSAGVCVPDDGNGTSCSAAGHCTSGNCVDGVCCDLACNGLCEACSATKKGAGTDGTCGAIGNGLDPDNECTGVLVCNGARACTTCDTTRSVTVGPGLALSIPDDAYNGTIGSMACASISVSAIPGCAQTITSLNVVLGMNHTWVGDLVIKLVSPAGTTVTLMSRPGFAETADDGTSGAGYNADLVNASPVTFVQSASTSAENMGSAGLVVCQGDGICSYLPNNGAAPAGNLTSFNGQGASGTWKLCVGDAAVTDTGSIDQVKLNFGF